MEHELQTIHWFPGHMMKTLRLIVRELPNVDLVIELLDARVPQSSKNPELASMIGAKPSLLLLNKSDLAEPEATERWLAAYRKQGYGAIPMNAKDRKSALRCMDAAKELLREKQESRRAKGMQGAKIRAMVVGVPNVGKSTLINALAGSAAAKTADKPGVTRGKQWVVQKDFELLDIPGVLWRRFEDQAAARKLAFTGAIKDDVFDTVEVAAALLDCLRTRYTDELCTRYKLELPLPNDNGALLAAIAKKRGMLLAKGELDLARASIMLLDELRGGKLGPITLDALPEGQSSAL